MNNVVYLIHFEKKLHHAGHYIGHAEDLTERLIRHRKGQGARILAALLERGIDWRVVRVWKGGREFERQLKNWKKARLLCPTCSEQPYSPRRRRQARRRSCRIHALPV